MESKKKRIQGILSYLQAEPPEPADMATEDDEEEEEEDLKVVPPEVASNRRKPKRQMY